MAAGFTAGAILGGLLTELLSWRWAFFINIPVAVGRSPGADALERGRTAAEGTPDILEAVMAIIRPVVECNRIQIDNGRTYLREMVFGDPEEPHHRDALALTVQTEAAITSVLRQDQRIRPSEAATLARIVSAIMFLAMAAPNHVASTVNDIVQDIRNQVRVLLPR